MRSFRSPRLPLALLGTVTSVLLFVAAGPTVREPATDPQAEVDRLRKLLRKEGGDSLRYELALALRDSGTIENRRFALDLFERLRSRHEDDPRYYWDRSLNFELGGRFMDARRDLERVIAIDPLDAEAHVRLSRLWLREVLRVYDLPLLPRMEKHLQKALQLDPEMPEALFLMSLTLHLEKFLPDADPPELTYRGRNFARRLLAADSTATQAHLLLAVHSLGISRFEDAEREFLTYLQGASPEVHEVFFTSNRASRAGIAERVRRLDADHQADYNAAWWWTRDPSPLSAVNEAQLEYWKRLAEAEFLFGEPARGTHGWDTEPGEAWIRLGAPKVRAFDPGAVESDPSATGAAAYKSTIRLTPPSWLWGYEIGGSTFALRFEDRSLHGRYIADKQTAVLMANLREAVPAVFQDAAPGRISTLFVSGTGAAGEDGKIHEALHLAIGPWRKPDGDKWLKDSRLYLTVRDSTYRKVVDTEHRILPRYVYEPAPGATVLVLSRDLNLVPGRYLVTASVEDRDDDLNGSVALVLEIPDFNRGDTLSISDLDLVLTAEAGDPGPTRTRLGRTYVANPMGMVADDRNLDVFYEIYNLVPRVRQSTYSLRYTVLPRSYVVGYDYHVRTGTARPNTLVALAEAGIPIQGVELSTVNYSDVRFPPEIAPLKPGQTQVKGARVDVGGLEPGEYVLVVTVVDEESGDEASRQRLFRIVTDETFRQLFTWKP